MPVMFIHGVNVRNSPEVREAVQVFRNLFQRQVLMPLASRFVDFRPFSSLAHVYHPNWGDDAVRFYWKLACVPRVRLSDALGDKGETGPGSPSPRQMVGLAALLDGRVAPEPGQPEPLCRAARRDLNEFMLTALGPLVAGEKPLGGDLGPEAQKAIPPLEAMLLVAAEIVANDPTVQQQVQGCQTDAELRRLLESQLRRCFDALVEAEKKTPETTTAEGMGPSILEEVAQDIQGEIGECFARLAHAPSRLLTVPLFTVFRGSLNENVARFVGDVFEYLNHRGDKDNPGQIVKDVLAEIEKGAKERPNEPWIVVTHSMGGNICYDVLTHFAPDWPVLLWVSVGGQVALFEEMKQFKVSNVGIASPAKVSFPGGRVKCWLNVYDPADPFAYLAEPVFDGVRKDIRFSTGCGDYHSHTTYFKRPSFYRAVRQALEEAWTHEDARR